MEQVRCIRAGATSGIEALIGPLRFGPFETTEAARAFENFMGARTDLAPISAAELFEGRVACDAVYLLDIEALAFGLHPLSEVHDIAIGDDNGDVPIYLSRRTEFLRPDAALLVQGAESCEPSRSLPRALPVPARISLGHAAWSVGEVAFHPSGGEILVVETASRNLPRYLTVWRRDGRQRLDLPVITGHSHRDYAVKRLNEAVERFEPAAVEISGRWTSHRDYQRERVYSFEARVSIAVGGIGRWLGSIEESETFLRKVYETSALGKPPKIAMGRSNLHRSYFKRTEGIRLASGDMHTRAILHEAAHHVADGLGREPGHGPIFVATLIGLLAVHEGADLDLMAAIAGEMGIDIDEAVLETFATKAATASGKPQL